MALGLRYQATILHKVRPLINIRYISTSKKNQDTAVIEAVKQPAIKIPAVNSNWVSYGFDRLDKQADRFSLHIIFFGTITLCLVFGSWYLMYAPDVNLKHWAQREAFIELRRREANGLPLIDKNIIDPELFTLPSDEELGDTDIII